MRVLGSDRIGRLIRGAGLVALAVLVWSVLIPSGALWTAVLAAGLISSAAVTAVLGRRRPRPSLAQVIASAESEPSVEPGRSRRATGALPPGRTP